MCVVPSEPKLFDEVRAALVEQYRQVKYTDGWTKEELRVAFDKYCAKNPNELKIVKKAYLFNLICRYAPIAPEVNDYFVGKVQHYNLLIELRNLWRLEQAKKEFGDKLGITTGAHNAQLDSNSHVCPDWERVLTLGIKGILERAKSKDTSYHRAVVLAFEGITILLKRFDKVHPNCKLALLAENPAATLQEALQVSYLYHELIEFDGIEVRSMGRFDKLFNSYYENDIANKIITKEKAAELLKYYFFKFFAKSQGLRFGKPFTFGPHNTPLTMLAFDVYNELNIVDPKFHLRLSKDTPEELLYKVSFLVANNRNAIVIVNNDIQEQMLIENGKMPKDAANYILIGCYEPAVMGIELNCSGAGLFSLVKPVELAIQEAKNNWTFDDFLTRFYQILQANLKDCLNEIRRWESLWEESNPSPLLSGPLLSCHLQSKDISQGGATYNTTGVCCAGLADAVDSIVAVKTLLEEKYVSNLLELKDILQNNWQNNELLRLKVMHKFPSWGNNIPEVDAIAIKIANMVADYINKEPNMRNGRFQAALYGILPAVQLLGEKTGALPNGRLAGTILTMNTNCENGRDINGITSLFHSVSSLPLNKFPNGTTLDVTLHPSTVNGTKGINTIKELIKSYFSMGGNTIQFNIFNKATLIEAQKNPEKYSNLQVRVCGWNLRFIDLAPEEQQIFIDRAGECE